MRHLTALSVMLVLTAFGAGCTPRASQPGAPTTATPGLPVLTAASFTTGEAFAALPPGDLLMTVDAGTLLNQTIPLAIANSPDEKTKFEKSLVELQEKSGIDPKQLKLVALSFKNPSASKAQVAGVVTGSFDTAKLSESLKKDPKTGVEAQVEQYNGQTIYVRKEPDSSDVFATAVLDSGTLVLGSSADLARQAIDAHAGKADNATKDAALFDAFKSTAPGVLRFAMRFPKDQITPEQAAKDPDMKNASAINFVTGSLDATSGLALRLTAKTGSPTDAQPLHDSLAKYLEMGRKFVGTNPDAKQLTSILNATQLSVNGSDVNFALSVSAEQLASIAADFQKMGSSFGGAASDMGGEPGDHDEPSEPNENKP